jgi:hypothetical protein
MYKLISIILAAIPLILFLRTIFMGAIEAIASRVRLQKTDRLSGMDNLDLDRVWACLFAWEADPT